MSRYCKTKLTQKDIHNVQYVACMNPTAGSFTINPRLQRHFATFSVVFPGADALFTIYNSILSDYLESPMNKFSLPVRKLVGSIVNATIQLHTKYTDNPYFLGFHIFTVTILKVCNGIQSNSNQVPLHLQSSGPEQRFPGHF